MTRQQERPKPGEFKEISTGSGPAAILLFLHIAATGYLGYIIYFLLRYNTEAYGSLLPFGAGLTLYFPAAFAILTPMPTDALTKAVGFAARLVGIGASLVYCAGLIWLATHSGAASERFSIVTACAIGAGITGALLARLIFSFGINPKKVPADFS